MIQYHHLNLCLNRLEYKLVNACNKRGFWEGRLSSSALSTSVALFALAKSDRQIYHPLIEQGLKWLRINQNQDGGWGDCPQCPSNLSTTLLTWAAFSLSAKNREKEECNLRAERWLRENIGSLKPVDIVSAVLSYYGNDRTFSAPILTMCALAGRLGDTPECWDRVPQLPMELAAFPHAWFQFLRLPVVSYAVPALIAIGLVKHKNRPSKWHILKIIRDLTIDHLLKKLKKMQPANGGFLEAAPLTAFVTMSLIGSEMSGHGVVKSGLEFLIQSQRPDGSWPIDTDLATWVTTLSIKAIADRSDGYLPLTEIHRKKLTRWLLKQQSHQIHPFTHSPPGGWSWTHHPGAVPDADDTAGALLALHHLGDKDKETIGAVQKGIHWLLKLQNRDGGIPTFCRGWGRLPFDRSCPDITAHTLSAWLLWKSNMPTDLQVELEAAIEKAIAFLIKNQSEDGSWFPLWFGNPWSKSCENPVYGTVQVLKALQNGYFTDRKDIQASLHKGHQFLKAIQNPDNGWGSSMNAPSSIEETALVLQVLAGRVEDYITIAGLDWLIREIIDREDLPSAPIGLYFAKLWYSEEQYPLIFSIAALRKMKKVLRDHQIKEEDRNRTSCSKTKKVMASSELNP